MADPWAAFDGTPGAVQQAAPTASAPAASRADAWGAFDGMPAPVTAATAPVTSAPTAVAPVSRARLRLNQMAQDIHQEAPGISAGLDRSLRDVVDRPAQWLATGADALGLTQGQGAAVQAGNEAERQAYEAQFGHDPAAQGARLGGQAALVLPVGGVLGQLGRAGGELLAAGASRVAPVLGDIAQGVTNFLGGTAGGAGGVGQAAIRGGSVVANSALQGAGAAALTSGQSEAPLSEQALQGAIIGGAIGPVVRGVAGGVGAVSNALGGSDINPEVAKLARLARDKYGIQLTADQISSSPFMQNLGSQLRQVPGSGMAPAQTGLQRQYTKAVGRTIGEEVDQITPAVMERATGRIGDVMNDVASSTSIKASDPRFLSDLAQIESDASMLTSEQSGVINKHLQNVLGAARDGETITGEQYQALTKMNSPLGRATRSADSDVRNAALDIRHALDDALERSLPEGSPLLDQLRAARLQYKNLKTIEPLVMTGEPGEISPGRLQSVVNRSFKGRALRETQPELGDLADIGARFNLRPDSGTAGRGAAYAAMGTLGGAATQIASGQLRNGLLTAAAIPATIGASRAASALWLRNPAYINKLLDQAGVTPAGSLTNQLLPYAAPVAAIGQGRIFGR